VTALSGHLSLQANALLQEFVLFPPMQGALLRHYVYSPRQIVY
jgi:hypothetical protein